MRHKLVKLSLSLGLLAAAAVASAAVEVRFIEPEKFADAGDFFGLRDRAEVLEDIRTHLRSLGEKQLAGKDLLIEVTDLDLAGNVEPVGRRMEMMRILRETGRPAMQLRYVLSEGGKELRRGEVSLSDSFYLDRFNRYSSGDMIRYEKRMMDSWFQKEFVPAQVVSKAGN